MADEQSAKKVLVVDDEAATRALLRATVEGLSMPCQVAEAADGDTAIELARRVRPDLVLLDIVLPGSAASGVLVCQELCKDSRTKVVIVSGQAQRSILDACFSAGAIQHVNKPFSVPELRDSIERWLAD
jgi:CheY-like chemotaxis protein